jgi:hypothetical protein
VLFIVCLNFEAQQLIGQAQQLQLPYSFLWRRYQKPPHSRAPTSVDLLCCLVKTEIPGSQMGARAGKPNGALSPRDLFCQRKTKQAEPI